MILLIDNYDSFSYNLYQLIGEIEPDIRVIRNDEMTIEEIARLAPDQIILSPGPGRPEEAGIITEIVTALGEKIPIHRRLPGSQAVCAAFGASDLLRRETDARKNIRCKIRHRMSPVPGMSGERSGRPLSFSRGKS